MSDESELNVMPVPNPAAGSKPKAESAKARLLIYVASYFTQLLPSAPRSVHGGPGAWDMANGCRREPGLQCSWSEFKVPRAAQVRGG